jgi:hypothetical protein
LWCWCAYWSTCASTASCHGLRNGLPEPADQLGQIRGHFRERGGEQLRAPFHELKSLQRLDFW